MRMPDASQAGALRRTGRPSEVRRPDPQPQQDIPGRTQITGLHHLSAVGRASDGTVPSDVGEQTTLALNNLFNALSLSGVGPGNIVRITIRLLDADDFGALNGAYLARFSPFVESGMPLPARSTVVVKALPDEGSDSPIRVHLDAAVSRRADSAFEGADGTRPEAAAGNLPYSRTRQVRPGVLLTAGHVGVDNGRVVATLEDQVLLALRNLGESLQTQHRALREVTSLRVYALTEDDYRKCERLLRGLFAAEGGAVPAMEWIPIEGLPRPESFTGSDLKVELDTVAEAS